MSYNVVNHHVLKAKWHTRDLLLVISDILHRLQKSTLNNIWISLHTSNHKNLYALCKRGICLNSTHTFLTTEEFIYISRNINKRSCSMISLSHATFPHWQIHSQESIMEEVKYCNVEYLLFFICLAFTANFLSSCHLKQIFYASLMKSFSIQNSLKN